MKGFVCPHCGYEGVAGRREQKTIRKPDAPLMVFLRDAPVYANRHTGRAFYAPGPDTEFVGLAVRDVPCAAKSVAYHPGGES